MARPEPGEREVQDGGAHLGADALALEAQAQPGTGGDLPGVREVAAGHLLRADDLTPLATTKLQLQSSGDQVPHCRK